MEELLKVRTIRAPQPKHSVSFSKSGATQTICDLVYSLLPISMSQLVGWTSLFNISEISWLNFIIESLIFAVISVLFLNERRPLSTERAPGLSVYVIGGEGSVIHPETLSLTSPLLETFQPASCLWKARQQSLENSLIRFRYFRWKRKSECHLKFGKSAFRSEVWTIFSFIEAISRFLHINFGRQILPTEDTFGEHGLAKNDVYSTLKFQLWFVFLFV